MDSQGTARTGRYAILTHDFPFFHWDLLLEVGEIAWTWRLTAENGSQSQEADCARAPLESACLDGFVVERIADHRRLYLDYEGPVSGNRGQVTRVDEGVFRLISETLAEFEVTFSGRGGSRTWRLPKSRS